MRPRRATAVCTSVRCRALPDSPTDTSRTTFRSGTPASPARSRTSTPTDFRRSATPPGRARSRRRRPAPEPLWATRCRQRRPQTGRFSRRALPSPAGSSRTARPAPPTGSRTPAEGRSVRSQSPPTPRPSPQRGGAASPRRPLPPVPRDCCAVPAERKAVPPADHKVTRTRPPPSPDRWDDSLGGTRGGHRRSAQEPAPDRRSVRPHT